MRAARAKTGAAAAAGTAAAAAEAAAAAAAGSTGQDVSSSIVLSGDLVWSVFAVQCLSDFAFWQGCQAHQAGKKKQ